jgi:phosphatidylglycerophosphate synthase
MRRALRWRPVRANLALVPNQLTALRLALVPVLWGLAVLEQPRLVAAGLLLAGLTDVLDGFLARRLGQSSAFGSALDSVADTLIVRSGIAWLALLKPALFSDHPVVLIVWLGLDTAAFTLGLVKFRRIGNLHLSSSKAAGLVQYAFAVEAFLVGGYLPWLFFVAAGLGIVAATEALLLLLTRTAVDEHIGSLVPALARRRRRGPGTTG